MSMPKVLYRWLNMENILANADTVLLIKELAQLTPQHRKSVETVFGSISDLEHRLIHAIHPTTYNFYTHKGLCFNGEDITELNSNLAEALIASYLWEFIDASFSCDSAATVCRYNRCEITIPILTSKYEILVKTLKYVNRNQGCIDLADTYHELDFFKSKIFRIGALLVKAAADDETGEIEGSPSAYVVRVFSTPTHSHLEYSGGGIYYSSYYSLVEFFKRQVVMVKNLLNFYYSHTLEVEELATSEKKIVSTRKTVWELSAGGYICVA